MVSAARAAKDPDWAFVPLGAMFLSLSEMWHMSKPVKKGLHFSNFWVILETCPNLWRCSCSKCYAIDCFGTYCKHVQTCDDVRVQSATQSTASVHTWNLSKPVMTFVFEVLRNRLLRFIRRRRRRRRKRKRRRRRRRRKKAREEDQMFKIWVLCRVCFETL